MFLINSSLPLCIIEYIFEFIEGHSVLVGILTSLIVSSLWMKKFLQQKRAEAYFGFYTQLLLHLQALEMILKENNLLNISDASAGNIYSLIYVDDCIKKICPSFKPLTDKELTLYRTAASEIKKILFETENNVYPRNADPDKWYRSQLVIISFCEFVENKEHQSITNIGVAESDSEPKHIMKCRELISAISYIKESIYNENY